MIFQVTKRGPGFWKFNTELLRDKDFVEGINRLLDHEMSQQHLYQNKKDHWEIIKLVIRNSILQFAARKRKSDHNKIGGFGEKT